MDQNRYEGAAREMGGKVEEAVGDLAGDAKMQVQGKIDQVAGSVQNSYGAAMEELQDLGERLRERTKEQPLTALFAAAAIGYVIGRIGRWL